MSIKISEVSMGKHSEEVAQMLIETARSICDHMGYDPKGADSILGVMDYIQSSVKERIACEMQEDHKMFNTDEDEGDVETEVVIDEPIPVRLHAGKVRKAT